MLLIRLSKELKDWICNNLQTVFSRIQERSWHMDKYHLTCSISHLGRKSSTKISRFLVTSVLIQVVTCITTQNIALELTA